MFILLRDNLRCSNSSSSINILYFYILHEFTIVIIVMFIIVCIATAIVCDLAIRYVVMNNYNNYC